MMYGNIKTSQLILHKNKGNGQGDFNKNDLQV